MLPNLLRLRFARLPLAVAVIAPFLALSVVAQNQIERQGYFEVRSAETQLENGVYHLDARLQLVLSSDALEALNSGVPLTIELEMQVIRVRRFLPDDVEADIATRFELEYRPLSQRYIVRNLNSGEQSSYATLFSALNALGRVTDLPVIDEHLLDAKAGYRIRLRAMLQTEQYSAPLRLLFFWRSEWHLQSDWYEWILKQ
jgi:Domain of unknown function (DUF4390)